MTMKDLGHKTSDLGLTLDIGLRTAGETKTTPAAGLRTISDKPSKVLSPEPSLSPESEVLSQNQSPRRKEGRK